MSKSRTGDNGVEDAATKDDVGKFLEAVSGYLGELTPEQRRFFTKLATETPEQVEGFLGAVKRGREADPKYAAGLQARNPNFSQRRVVRKSISEDEQNHSFENGVRHIEDDPSWRSR